MSLWCAEDVVAATGGITTGSWEAERVVIDSRSIQPGDIFLALVGERHNAHRFVAQALKQGAVAAIVSEPVEGVPAVQLLQVKDTMRALEQLGEAARARFSGIVFGITGSVGKTSAKETLANVLRAIGHTTHATAGNYNNHIGVPLTLANMPTKADSAVIEMGMNHAGEIDVLTRWAQPHIALITAIEAAHIEFFDSVEAIAHAKMEIAAGLVANGTLILPADSPYYALMNTLAETCKIASVKSFGQAEMADYQLQKAETRTDGLALDLSLSGESLHCQIGVHGKHWGGIAAAVLGLLHVAKLDWRTASQALAALHAPIGRGSVHNIALETANASRSAEATLIDDSYNASPASMRAAFETLLEIHKASKQTGKKIALLGEMLELGQESAQAHVALAAPLSEHTIDRLFLCGEGMKPLAQTLENASKMHVSWYADTASLHKQLLSALSAGDTLLVKGSHGSGVYRIAQALKQNNTTTANT